MLINTPKRILFILCFSCFTSMKHSANPPITKITDSDKQNRFPIISLMMKPFQNSPTKTIDIEDYQTNTLQWVHKRLMLFIQNLDKKILFHYKPDGQSKILDRAPDQRTVLSFQWQDMKSHFLIPIAKKHIRVYTPETLNKLEKVKRAFFTVLKLYRIKLITLEKDKTLEMKRGYNKQLKSFDREQDLEGERIILHNELYTLLVDLPTILMYWSPQETEELKQFAEIYGKLPEPSDDDFGDDDEDTVTFGGGNFKTKEKNKKEKHSDSSSDSSSSSDCFSDHDSDFFDKLTREDFLSEDENGNT
ncbi:uncharacterized protein LOC135845219 [Planococcus citri]|uniref:uncharacterized protein LOC135845219 n=1 Tax=Planococcus citri TaxID=170843 RepID=UPI0031F89EAA